MTGIWSKARRFVVEKRKIAYRKPKKEAGPPKAKKRTDSQLVQEVTRAARLCRFPKGWWQE